MIIIPAAHAVVLHSLGKKREKTDSIFGEGITPFLNRPDRTAKTQFNLGTSVTVKRGKMEYSLTTYLFS